MKIIVITLSVLLAHLCSSQEEPTQYSMEHNGLGLPCPPIPKEYSQKEFKAPTRPVFPGGEDSLMRFIRTNLVLPERTDKSDSCVLILVFYKLDTSGRVKKAHVHHQLSDKRLYKYENEATRVVSLLPDFEPATYNGSPVECSLSVVVPFVYCNEDD